MPSHQEALDLIINIKRDLNDNKRIILILPKILELSKIINDNELEDICNLELRGYFETDILTTEKIDEYAKKVGRVRIFINENGEKKYNESYKKDSLMQIEEKIKFYTDIKTQYAFQQRDILVGRRSSIEAFFINKINVILRILKEYYPVKIIDEYLDTIFIKLERLSDSLLDKFKSIYNNLYSANEGDLLNIPELSRKIIVEIAELIYPKDKIELTENRKIYKRNNGEEIEINDTDGSYENKLIAFIDDKISSDKLERYFISELELIIDNIIKFSDLVSKYSQISEIHDEDKNPIISLAIRIVIFVGDLLYFIRIDSVTNFIKT
jgi:hypothetical protein